MKEYALTVQQKKQKNLLIMEPL